jgi:DNA-binding NarL/FixJ family response regulator
MRLLKMQGFDIHRVIVADDDPEFMGWLRSLLNGSKDFLVVGEAKNGVETLNLVSSLTPDLVITDLHMPEPDGVAVTRHIREKFPGTKSILISAHEGRIWGELAVKEGALAYIPKRQLSLGALRQALQT